VAAVLGLSPAQVTVIEFAAPGSYGRGNLDNPAIEAALLSQKVGRPVRVQWMRQEEFIWSTQKTAEAFHFQGGVDSQGKLLGWQSEVWSDTHIVNTGAFFGATYGGGVLPIYAAPHKTEVHYVQTALRKGAMRGLGAWPTVFAHEGFVDELAFLSGTDPVAFRLQNLTDPRGIAVIQEAARLAGWTSHTKPRANGVGQGISFLADMAAGTYIAEIATVQVDTKTGQVAVQKVAAVQDCGLVINPNGVRNQVEGGILQGTSWTLHEQLKFNRQTVTSVDWLSYPILRYAEVPTVDVKLIDRPDLPASGVGEPSSMAIGAAIGNAFFDATGVRMRATPFTPERVKMYLG
jgi:CO/xanthine dehydrogenase Mo-binding subunit